MTDLRPVVIPADATCAWDSDCHLPCRYMLANDKGEYGYFCDLHVREVNLCPDCEAGLPHEGHA